MNQYERIVSYIYRYDKGQKGMNVGFARVERRGQRSRITIQLRASLVQKIHEGYLFWQQSEGIRTIPMGRLALRGGNFVLKVDTDTERLLGTEQTLGQIEGIFIDVERDVYYATTWKNDSFRLGDWREWQSGITGVSGDRTEEQVARDSENAGDSAATVGVGEANIAEKQEAEVSETDTQTQGSIDTENAKNGVVKEQGTLAGMNVGSQQEMGRNQGTMSGMNAGNQQEVGRNQGTMAGTNAGNQQEARKNQGTMAGMNVGNQQEMGRNQETMAGMNTGNQQEMGRNQGTMAGMNTGNQQEMGRNQGTMAGVNAGSQQDVRKNQGTMAGMNAGNQQEMGRNQGTMAGMNAGNQQEMGKNQGTMAGVNAGSQQEIRKNQSTGFGMIMRNQRAVVKNQGIMAGMDMRGRQEIGKNQSTADGIDIGSKQDAVKRQGTVDNMAARSQQETATSQEKRVDMVAQNQGPATEKGVVNTQTAQKGQGIEVGSGDAGNGWEMGERSQAKGMSVPLEQGTAEKGSTAEKDVEQAQADMQIQSICSTCPFKRKNYDYGKKILMTFPSMKPFPAGIAKACVRMELQDIGCLPVASWQLAGNRFLLHGYYCYRHLLFAQLADGSYVLGVPGVFSDKEKRNAARFGFDTFQAIGEPVATQGVFGYWMMDMQPAA